MTVVSLSDASIYKLALVKLAILLKKSKYTVVFTGAGISTASGLADYRGNDGVWTRKNKGMSEKPTKAFASVKPTKAHKAIKDLLKAGIIKYVISQNIDNLHRRSGIPTSHLAEIHGNYNILRCSHCDKRSELKDVGISNRLQSLTQPYLPRNDIKCKCGGLIIPTYVNFGSPTMQKELSNAFYNAQRSDVFMAIGTTLSVEPASLIPKKALHKNAKLIIINLGPTAYDNKAFMKFKGDINKILPDLYKKIKKLRS